MSVFDTLPDRLSGEPRPHPFNDPQAPVKGFHYDSVDAAIDDMMEAIAFADNVLDRLPLLVIFKWRVVRHDAKGDGLTVYFQVRKDNPQA